MTGTAGLLSKMLPSLNKTKSLTLLKRNSSGKPTRKLRMLTRTNKRKKENTTFLKNKLLSLERKISNWPQRLKNMQLSILNSSLKRKSKKLSQLLNQLLAKLKNKHQLTQKTLRRKISQMSRLQFPKLWPKLNNKNRNRFQLFKKQQARNRIKR